MSKADQIERKPLTHTRQIDTAKPEEKPYTLNAGDGLLSAGVYPAVGLADAKEKRDEWNKLVAQGMSPSQQRKREKSLPDHPTVKALR